MPWEPRCLYLGVMLKSGPVFDCCVKKTLAKFYRSLNSIIRIKGRSDDMVMLRLLEAHCLPILTYAIETIHSIHISDRDDRRHMRVAYNEIYRKMFGYSYRESVELLQHSPVEVLGKNLLEIEGLNFSAVSETVLVALLYTHSAKVVSTIHCVIS